VNTLERDDQRVVRRLAGEGVYVESVYDLINKRIEYKKAIPVLLELLDVIENDRIREGIIRALTVRAARGVASKRLIDEFRRLDVAKMEVRMLDIPGVGKRMYGAQEGLKWAVGNALSVVADESIVDDLIELVADPAHGTARRMLPDGLAKLKDPRIPDVLIGLLDDEDITGHVVSALGKMRVVKARSRIEKFLNHPKAWIRKGASNALQRIDGQRASRPKRKTRSRKNEQ